MLAKYEGLQEIDGKVYPLGIVSNNLSKLENYFKKIIENKITVKLDKITSKILEEYGTSTIILSYISHDIFYLSFKTDYEYKKNKKRWKSKKKRIKTKRKSKKINLLKNKLKESKQKEKKIINQI